MTTLVTSHISSLETTVNASVLIEFDVTRARVPSVRNFSLTSVRPPLAPYNTPRCSMDEFGYRALSNLTLSSASASPCCTNASAISPAGSSGFK